jgi:hypothetical protein
VISRLLKSEVLHDVWMVKVLECVALRHEGLHYLQLPAVTLVTRGLGQLDLLHRNHLSGRRVQRQVDTSVCSLANQLSLDPFEDRCLAVSNSTLETQTKKYSRLGFGTPGGESGVADRMMPLACAGVTSSTRLPQSFVLRFRKMFCAVEPIFEARSCATTLIDFLCLVRLGGGNAGGGGCSACVGDDPPDGVASMTGLSRSWSGKNSSRRSYMSSGGGLNAQVIESRLVNELCRLTFPPGESCCLLLPARYGGNGGGSGGMGGMGGVEVWIGSKPIFETLFEVRFLSPGFHGCQSVAPSDSLSLSSSSDSR